MGAQFRSKFIFQLLAGTMFLNKSLCWFCNERHHGKGPMDGAGGTIKNVIFPKSKVRPDCGPYTKRIFSCCHEICAIYYCLSRSDETVEPGSIHQAPSIPETLPINKFFRQINDKRDCSAEFFKTAVVQKAFHT